MSRRSSFVDAKPLPPPAVEILDRALWRNGNRCERCELPFTVLRFMHHCRLCGGSFCDSCSAVCRFGELQTLVSCRACRSCAGNRYPTILRGEELAPVDALWAGFYRFRQKCEDDALDESESDKNPSADDMLNLDDEDLLAMLSKGVSGGIGKGAGSTAARTPVKGQAPTPAKITRSEKKNILKAMRISATGVTAPGHSGADQLVNVAHRAQLRHYSKVTFDPQVDGTVEEQRSCQSAFFHLFSILNSCDDFIACAEKEMAMHEQLDYNKGGGTPKHGTPLQRRGSWSRMSSVLSPPPQSTSGQTSIFDMLSRSGDRNATKQAAGKVVPVMSLADYVTRSIESGVDAVLTAKNIRDQAKRHICRPGSPSTGGNLTTRSSPVGVATHFMQDKCRFLFGAGHLARIGEDDLREHREQQAVTGAGGAHHFNHQENSTQRFQLRSARSHYQGYHVDPSAGVGGGLPPSGRTHTSEQSLQMKLTPPVPPAKLQQSIAPGFTAEPWFHGPVAIFYARFGSKLYAMMRELQGYRGARRHVMQRALETQVPRPGGRHDDNERLFVWTDETAQYITRSFVPLLHTHEAFKWDKHHNNTSSPDGDVGNNKRPANPADHGQPLSSTTAEDDAHVALSDAILLADYCCTILGSLVADRELAEHVITDELPLGEQLNLALHGLKFYWPDKPAREEPYSPPESPKKAAAKDSRKEEDGLNRNGSERSSSAESSMPDEHNNEDDDDEILVVSSIELLELMAAHDISPFYEIVTAPRMDHRVVMNAVGERLMELQDHIDAEEDEFARTPASEPIDPEGNGKEREGAAGEHVSVGRGGGGLTPGTRRGRDSRTMVMGSDEPNYEPRRFDRTPRLSLGDDPSLRGGRRSGTPQSGIGYGPSLDDLRGSEGRQSSGATPQTPPIRRSRHSSTARALEMPGEETTTPVASSNNLVEESSGAGTPGTTGPVNASFGSENEFEGPPPGQKETPQIVHLGQLATGEPANKHGFDLQLQLRGYNLGGNSGDDPHGSVVVDEFRDFTGASWRGYLWPVANSRVPPHPAAAVLPFSIPRRWQEQPQFLA